MKTDYTKPKNDEYVIGVDPAIEVPRNRHELAYLERSVLREIALASGLSEEKVKAAWDSVVASFLGAKP